MLIYVRLQLIGDLKNSSILKKKSRPRIWFSHGGSDMSHKMFILIVQGSQDVKVEMNSRHWELVCLYEFLHTIWVNDA